ncbi:hypothetical protein TanjilG_13263 [Lupinus angustifolius]|uniref:ELM2 domain-containing protein n=1 Tax=Lupinus angustifolius TaxID=3871 RepID=A0A4P1RUG5_LUPAN|nr:PREDICTED: uncharacterized protein LOC109353694 [Lupinus angustifolius]XP_019451604.1 PREDICTED: uncharacterized protein LOC109353694 [Lupinus angustifolius]XP_019451612.1 PREDICTED: uncharacterized protein LOC109353694 [Lupinus angustifolius]XP_019451620.1 PREDICTED: uncharacterized protein LOC109353694 [Lupinus angustifolius]OIW18511.1 hypothetical protein TanjilG_13263 [Lupinus angustifolius]
MVQKRPFDVEEMLDGSFKHPKHVGPSDQLVSFSESAFPEAACQIPKTSVELPKGAVDLEKSFPEGISVPSWATINNGEDVQLEPPVYLPFVPEYFSPERPMKTIVRYVDIYSILLENPPHKLIPVGANHQADIPAWDSSATSRPRASDAVQDEAEERLMGTCIIPMPQMELSVHDDGVGKGRTDCSCEDKGSVRCVRQHIIEAREKLVKTFGHEKFTDLGLSDMGEQVAAKWSAEEEQLFCEVVFNNPATLGRNFWNYLSIVFPLKTKREIVCYYFNVFMLRRRAEQNRNSFLNIDSDDDEWQGDDGNEISTQEEDEDSIAESPVYEGDACLFNCHENDLQDNDDYASDETCVVNETADFTDRNVSDDSIYEPAVNPHSFGPPSLIQPQDQPLWQVRFDEDVRDALCKSSDVGVAPQETQVKAENGDHWHGNYNGVCKEPCDAKVWGSGSVLL